MVKKKTKIKTSFRSGKTSIVKLIFEKMTPGETLKLAETKLVQLHGEILSIIKDEEDRIKIRSFLFRNQLWNSFTISNS